MAEISTKRALKIKNLHPEIKYILYKAPSGF
jgi:hypothetical protein